MCQIGTTRLETTQTIPGQCCAVPGLVGAWPNTAHKYEPGCVVLGNALHEAGSAILVDSPFFFKCQNLYLMLYVDQKEYLPNAPLLMELITQLGQREEQLLNANTFLSMGNLSCPFHTLQSYFIVSIPYLLTYLQLIQENLDVWWQSYFTIGPT